MAMSFMWLLLTVTVTCLCASPRCKSNAASLSFSDYCQKLCVWGRGGNLCHCNAVHFVGKRRDLRQTGRENGRGLQIAGLGLGSDDDGAEEIWDSTGDDLKAAEDENSTSADDVWEEQNDDDRGPFTSQQRRRPMFFVGHRRLSRRHVGGAESVEQWLRDSAKKGKTQAQVVVDQQQPHDRRRVLTSLNALTRKPTTFILPDDNQKPEVSRKMVSHLREFLQFSKMSVKSRGKSPGPDNMGFALLKEIAPPCKVVFKRNAYNLHAVKIIPIKLLRRNGDVYYQFLY